MANDLKNESNIAKRLIVSSVAAAALLVAFVLPAEYGVDPTGVGELTGVKTLSKATAPAKAGTDFGQSMSFNIEKYDLEAETINQSIQGLLTLQDKVFKSETIMIDLDDFGEMEHKFIMKEGSSLNYSWKVLNAKGDGVFAEFHGHPSTKDAPNYPEGFEQAYSKDEGTTQSGTFTAPFPGYHGWFFMNLEEGPIKIEVTVSGYYEEHKEMHRAVDGVVTNKVEF